jgi:toxin ParE1/3/4
MMSHIVAFSPEAEAQLVALYEYVAADASPEVAERFTSEIVAFCESLCTFPNRGSLREDIRPGLRVTGYRRSVTIAFHVGEGRVDILGVFYGGRDYEAVLQGDV